MDESEPYLLHPIGVVRATLRAVARAPNQGGIRGRTGSAAGDRSRARRRAAPHRTGRRTDRAHLAASGRRRVLQTHPTGDERIPLTGVFRTRSPDRPNPIGVHRVTVTGFEGPTTFRVGALEAIDGTPIVDLKIVMDESRDE